MTSIGPNCRRCRESLLHLRPHLQLCVVIIRLPIPRSDLSPAVADIGAHVAMFEISVSELLWLVRPWEPEIRQWSWRCDPLPSDRWEYADSRSQWVIASSQVKCVRSGREEENGTSEMFSGQTIRKLWAVLKAHRRRQPRVEPSTLAPTLGAMPQCRARSPAIRQRRRMRAESDVTNRTREGSRGDGSLMTANIGRFWRSTRWRCYRGAE